MEKERNAPRRDIVGRPKRGYLQKEPKDPEREELYEILAQLSPFEQRFIEAYPKASSGAEAARMAGSIAKRPEQVANNTLRKKEVMRAIALMRARRIEASGLDEVEVIEKIRSVFTQALAHKKYQDANKAAELLGAHLGMFRGYGKQPRKSPLIGPSEEAAQLQEEADKGGLSRLLRNADIKDDLAAMAEIVIRTRENMDKKQIDVEPEEVEDIEEVPQIGAT